MLLTTTKIEFTEEDKIKTLLWCDRHCCLCGKQCSTNIVIHHIEQEGTNLSDIDNAIPLCLECHGKIRSYDPKHPIGTKYKVKEIKTRRDQIYERYTRHLVPPMNIELINIVPHKRPTKLKVRTRVTHLSDLNPVKFKIKMRAYVGEEDKGLIKSKYYSGDIVWYFNPKLSVTGSFGIDKEWVESDKPFRIQCNATIIDIYKREHPLFPFCYTYVKDRNTWSYEPTSIQQILTKI